MIHLIRLTSFMAALALAVALAASVAPGECGLILTMHHILSDGASMGLFFDELTRLYSSRDEAAALEVQFADWAEWERAQRNDARDEVDTVYWRKALGGSLPVCTWKDQRGRASQRGAQVPLLFPPATVERLEALGRRYQATTNQVLLSAWFVLLGAHGKRDDVCTGAASSLRQRRELEPLIGFFVQSLLIRVDLGGDPSFRTLLQRVREGAFDAQAHGALPFDRILRAAEHASGDPFPQAFFSHMKDAIRAPSLPGTVASWEFVDPGIARFELSLVLHEAKDELEGFLEYDTGVLAPESAQRLADDYVRLVSELLDRPDRSVSEFQALRTRPIRRIRRGRAAEPPRYRRAAGEGR